MENNLTGLKYDECSYNEKLKRSMGPGAYQLGTYGNDCSLPNSKNMPDDPFIRYQKYGASTCYPGQSINDNSELSGRNYKSSKCNSKQYQPGGYSTQGICQVSINNDVKSGNRPTESTRISNNACNLRGTGINRWEWLCDDPQENYFPQFDFMTSSRINTLDNHIPCIETPLDESKLQPPINNFDPEYKPINRNELNTLANKYPYGGPSWKSCDEIK